ncbi:FtsK-like domain-containing protein [Stieleria maiorica]|uniref:FtsK-like domain-containing protein n=1 Tax=Stieleria maiorica TaxID=2795974 RepID=A0A5B9MM65_9BACT|nr:FtsK/SpoIIIE domain-containing protein [Stieleria maiorica]QEG02393.1 FtsK-like domain-containing protein [Stieleria maiorica]
MNPTELIGEVFTRYLASSIDIEGDEGTARLMIDHLSACQTVAIAKAILLHGSLSGVVDLKINKEFVGESDLPERVLTTDPATYFRNCKCDRPILLVAATGDDEEQSLKEFVRIGADELKASPKLWVDAASSGIALTDDHKTWWEKALAGLCDLRVIALERLAEYVVKTRELIEDEGLPVGKALGQSLPALRFPMDSGFFDRIADRTRTHKSAWNREFKRVYGKNACFLEKRTPSQLILSEDDLRKSFDKVKSEIGEHLHPTIETFIDAPSGWNEAASALAHCEWEDVRLLFDGLRRVKLNLGEETRQFYDELNPDLLSETDNDYLDILVTRKKLGEATEEDQQFYESHRNEIKEDRKLRSGWDKFIYGRPRECTDFVIGLAACIESLFNQVDEAKKRTLLIRCDSANKRDLRNLNYHAGEYFATRYAGLKSLLGNRVKWEVGKLFDFPELVEQWRESKKKLDRLNTSQAKNALQLKFFLEVETEATEGTIDKTSTQLVWTYDVNAVTSSFVADWRRLVKHPLVRCRTGLDPISSKGIYQTVSLSDVQTFQPSYDRTKGSFVATYKKDRDIQIEWQGNLAIAQGDGFISEAVASDLKSKFDDFAADYSEAIEHFPDVGVTSESLTKQLKSYTDLLSAICTNAKGDRNRQLLLRPLLQIGAVEIDSDVTTVIVAPWHPLRMAAIAKKAQLVADIIKRLLTEKQVEFGDQRLYFKEMVRELEHPFYPEVVVGWTESEAHILSVTDAVGDYSLHEPPVLQKKRIAATNENPGPAAARVMELLRQYVRLHPHERANLSLVLFNSDSSRLPQAVVDKIAALHEDDEEVHCQIILRHTNPNRLRHLYQEIIESADEDVDSYSPSEATQDFLARLRIGILVDQAAPPDPKDGPPHDISFSQDVIARHAELEWCSEDFAPIELEHFIPPRWSRRRPAAKDDLKSIVYLCCPVQSKETWAYLTAVTTFRKGGGDWDGNPEKRLLPVRQLDFSNNETRQIFEETHNLANWVVNYDELLDRRQLQNQSVRIIRYKQSATQGRNLIISSTASSGMLRTMLINRLRRLNLDLTDAEYQKLAEKLIEDANSISGDLALRAAKRGRSAYELMGVVLSRYLIRHEFTGDRYFGWYFLDDYAEWLGQKEEQIADLMVVSPEQTENGLLLSIIVSESKYIDEANLAPKKKESQKQLRDTVRRVHEALFGNPDRLDRELWLARLSDLVLDGVLFSAGQSPKVSDWRRNIRGGSCKIMLRGYSHVFVHSQDSSDTNTFPLDQVENCHQEVFARKELRELMLAYWKDDDPTSVRNREFDFPPSNTPHEFLPPTAIRRSSDIVKRFPNSPDRAVPPTEAGSQQSHAKTDTESPEIEIDPSSDKIESINPRESGQNSDQAGILTSKESVWAFDGLSRVIEAHVETRLESEADIEWLKEVVKRTKTGLQQYNLQAKLKSETMTPNAALLKFEGSSHLTVDQVVKRQSEFLTTHGLNIISVQPEPGIVSIAVARREREVVNLAAIWKRWSPARSDGNQSIAIAVRENDGSILYLDPGQKHAPHTLIAGSTGSGKSVLMQNILLGIAATNTVKQAEIVLIDPKQGVDYFQFEDLPHLGGGVITDDQKAIERLQSLVVEMDARYSRFRQARANNITSYNNKVDTADRMPTIWLIHDEFAEWMMVEEYKEAVSTTVQRLGVKARAAGIHLIFAAQRPDANVMPMQLRSNLGNRLILRVDGEGTSEIALGEKGAEKLLGKGHLLAKLEGEPVCVYAQVPLASGDFVDAAIHEFLSN